MSEYNCGGCAILCQCKIPDECDFTPEGCLASFEIVEPKWEKEGGEK